MEVVKPSLVPSKKLTIPTLAVEPKVSPPLPWIAALLVTVKAVPAPVNWLPVTEKVLA